MRRQAKKSQKALFRRVKNERAYAIVLVLFFVAMLGVAASYLAGMWKDRSADTKYTRAATEAASIENFLKKAIFNNTIWAYTIQQNSTFSCLGGNCASQSSYGPSPAGTFPAAPGSVSGLFKLVDASGAISYDPSVATAGFDMNGNVCNTFNATNGDINCPFRAILYWNADPTTCGGGASCNLYFVNGYVLYQPYAQTGHIDFKTNFNPKTYFFTIAKNKNNTQNVCCSITCQGINGSVGQAYAYFTIGDAKNCYAGSVEVGNDACNSAMFSDTSAAPQWVPGPGTGGGTAGTNSTSTGDCP